MTLQLTIRVIRLPASRTNDHRPMPRLSSGRRLLTGQVGFTGHEHEVTTQKHYGGRQDAGIQPGLAIDSDAAWKTEKVARVLLSISGGGRTYVYNLPC